MFKVKEKIIKKISNEYIAKTLYERFMDVLFEYIHEENKELKEFLIGRLGEINDIAHVFGEDVEKRYDELIDERTNPKQKKEEE